MKNIIYLIILILLFHQNIMYSQWIQTNGPEGGVVFCSLVKGEYIFIGCEGGVFRTTDGGVTWKASNNGFTNFNINVLACSGNNLLAGTQGGGVFLSTDNGDHWTAVNNGLTNKFVQTIVAIDSEIIIGTNGDYGGTTGCIFNR